MRPGLALLVAGLLLGGCVSVKTESREILRVAPLRGAAVAAPPLDPEPALIAAGADLLTDDELKGAQAAIAARLAADLPRDEGSAPGRALHGARLTVDRCKLSAQAGRRSTVHRARCRVSLRAADAQLAAHEATVTREGPARVVTEARAAEIKRQTRNPLLAYDESERALTEAALVAARALLETAPPAEADPGPTLRRSALDRLARAERVDQLAAAAVDLARYGETADALALLPHLDHAHPLVRRAVATALAELLHRDAWAPVNARLQNEEEDAVRVPLQQAVARMRALYPDLAYPERPMPSKSSTAGGRESGVTP